jgi:hypothetical protein
MNLRRLLCAFLFIVGAVFAAGLYAQAPASSAGIAALNGNWTGRRCLPTDAEICPTFNRNSQLTGRAKAFRDAFDEIAVPKYDCAPTTIPILFTDPYAFQIDQKSDRVVFTYEKDDVVRTAWLESANHPKPKVGEFFTWGYSTARYEGNQLVIDTTKFAFDPMGLENDGGTIPSSTRKHMIERYYIDGERLSMDLTVEDPVFLLEPARYGVTWGKSNAPLELPWACDPVAASEPLEYLPTKYPDPKK